MFVEAGEGEFVVSGKGLGRECGRNCGGVVFARGLRGGDHTVVRDLGYRLHVSVRS